MPSEEEIRKEIGEAYSYLEGLSSTGASELRRIPARQRINFPEKGGFSGYQSTLTDAIEISNGTVTISAIAGKNSVGVVDRVTGISVALPEDALTGWEYEGYFPKEILEGATIVLESHWPAQAHQLMKVNTDKGSPYIGYATSIEVPYGRHERMLVAGLDEHEGKRLMSLSFSGYVPAKEELIDLSAKIYSDACQYKATR